MLDKNSDNTDDYANFSVLASECILFAFGTVRCSCTLIVSVKYAIEIDHKCSHTTNLFIVKHIYKALINEYLAHDIYFYLVKFSFSKNEGLLV